MLHRTRCAKKEVLYYTRASAEKFPRRGQWKKVPKISKIPKNSSMKPLPGGPTEVRPKNRKLQY